LHFTTLFLCWISLLQRAPRRQRRISNHPCRASQVGPDKFHYISPALYEPSSCSKEKNKTMLWVLHYMHGEWKSIAPHDMAHASTTSSKEAFAAQDVKQKRESKMAIEYRLSLPTSSLAWDSSLESHRHPSSSHISCQIRSKSNHIKIQEGDVS
jgi:hypothetical protein